MAECRTPVHFNPLKPKKREREEKVGGGGVAIGITFNGRGRT
jgi:hypothetical protein